MSETSAPTIAFEERMPRLPIVWNNHSMAWISDRIAGIVHSDGKAETHLQISKRRPSVGGGVKGWCNDAFLDTCDDLAVMDLH